MNDGPTALDTPVTPVPEEVRQLTDLVVRCPELRELEKLLGKFNLFRVLRFEHGEIRHSNVLAWLLDPEESHGLRDLFLRHWLMRVLAEGEVEDGSGLDPVTIESCEFRWVQVVREWRNLDVLVRIETLEQGLWVVAIENKVRATQASGQLQKYRKLVEDSFKDASKRLFIFLTQREEEPEDTAYVAASYQQVSEVLRDCIDQQDDVIGSEPRVLLDHYLDILEEVFMENSKVAELARRIYQSHRAALDVIFEHRPDELQNLSEALKQKMEASAGDQKFAPMVSTKGFIRFLPEAWDTPTNRKGNAWGLNTASAFVLCELSVWSRCPLLKMVEGKAPDAWRTKLWQISLQPPFKKTQKRVKKPEMWMSFYSVKNSKINLDDLELGQEDEMAEKVWNWVKQQLADENWNESIKAVALHLKDLHVQESA